MTICLSLRVIWRNREGAACSYREQHSSDGPGVSDMAYDTRCRTADWLTSVLKGSLLPCGLSPFVTVVWASFQGNNGQRWKSTWKRPHSSFLWASPVLHMDIGVERAASHVCFCFLGGTEWRWAIEVEKKTTFLNHKEQLIFGTTMSKLDKEEREGSGESLWK